MNVFDKIASVNDVINNFVWVTLGLVLLLGTGILMTCLTKFFQVTHFGLWMKNTIGKIFHKDVVAHSKERASISQFQALCTALAATIGVGNIAGVAAAITLGGAGSVFWMWVAAFFGMMTNYSENVLGIYYRRKNSDGEWSGGAMYYLQDGLGSRKHCKKLGRILGIVFSCFTVIASFGIGNIGQVNNIVSNIEKAFPIPALSNHKLFAYEDSASLYALLIGCGLVLLGALIILGGLKRIAAFAEKVVPFMVILYMLGSFVIIIVNAKQILPAFGAIFGNAFSNEAIGAGIVGVFIKKIVTWGFKRGVFSNEAGLGSSVMVHSNSNTVEPVKQGMWGIFEVFMDTIVVCSITALVILTSGVVDLSAGGYTGIKGGETLVAQAFNSVFSVGNIGQKFIAVVVLLFAFTTVLGWSHYGTKAWEYLFGTKATIGYKIFFVLMIVSGSVLTSSLAWDISDTFNGLMMIPNLIGVLSLSGLVVKITKNYLDRYVRKKNVEPMLSAFPDIQEEQKAKLVNDREED